jgi:hypothetical protein
MKVENKFSISVPASVKSDRSTSYTPSGQSTAFQYQLEEAALGNKSDVREYSEEEVKVMRSASHEDLEFIRTHGFQAYAEKLREGKIAEQGRINYPVYME